MAKQDYSGESIAACCGSSLHLWRPTGKPNEENNIIGTDRSVIATAWNRNNKVIATAREDGGVELRYSNGALMSLLPRGGPHPDSKPLTSLSWSMGSKRLATGSKDGNVFLYDMTDKKSCMSYNVTSSSPITSLAYHPEDKFLAVATNDIISLWSPQMTHQLTSPLSNNTSNNASSSHITSFSIATERPYIAAAASGSALDVWDYKTQQLLYSDATPRASSLSPCFNRTTSEHTGPSIQFAPLDAHLLWSSSEDGMAILRDLRSSSTGTRGSSLSSPVLRITVNSAISCMGIRENHTAIALGTIDGRVLVFDPRQPALPLSTLDAAKHLGIERKTRVTCVHWQHNYQSLVGASRLHHQHATEKVGDVNASNTAHTTVNTLNTTTLNTTTLNTTTLNTTTLNTTTLNTTTLNTTTTTTNIPLNNNTPCFSSLQDIKREPLSSAMPMAGAATEASGRPSFCSTTAILDSAMHPSIAPTAVSLDGLPIKEKINEQDHHHTSPMEATAQSRRHHHHPQPSSHLLAAPSSSTAAGTDRSTEHSTGTLHGHAVPEMWSIKAQSPFKRRDPLHGLPERETAGHLPPSPLAANTKKLLLDTSADTAIKNIATNTATSSPPLATRSTMVDDGTPAMNTSLVVSPSEHALRNDILAMHLDMLNHFEKQQSATQELIASVVSRQDDLAREMVSLRNQIRDLLGRRNNVLWL